MNWYKLSQQNNLSQQYIQLIEHTPTDIQIIGSGLNQNIQIPGGKSINARDLLTKALQKIKPILTKKGVNKIDTSSVSNPSAAGLAISHEPGVIHIDIPKIFNQFRTALPPITQLDGINTDPDVINDAVNKISAAIISQIGEILPHEALHREQFSTLFQQGKPFSGATESPAEQFGKQISKQYFPVTFKM